jgi:hypothetical protein
MVLKGKSQNPLFQEEVIGSKEKSSPQPDLEEYTYLYVPKWIDR